MLRKVQHFNSQTADSPSSVGQPRHREGSGDGLLPVSGTRAGQTLRYGAGGRQGFETPPCQAGDEVGVDEGGVHGGRLLKGDDEVSVVMRWERSSAMTEADWLVCTDPRPMLGGSGGPKTRSSVPLDHEVQDRGCPFDLLHAAWQLLRCHPLRVVALERGPGFGQVPLQFRRLPKAARLMPTKVLDHAWSHGYAPLLFLWRWPHQGQVKAPLGSRPPSRIMGDQFPRQRRHLKCKPLGLEISTVGFSGRLDSWMPCMVFAFLPGSRSEPPHVSSH